MHKLRAKLQSQQGETLVEVLCTVLIASLASALLVSMINVSGRMILITTEAEEKYYQNITEAETFSSAEAESGTLTIYLNDKQMSEAQVRYHGDSFFSYQLEGWGNE